MSGYEGLYEISRKGIIRSLHKANYKNTISVRPGRGGYFSARLSKEGKSNSKYLHRLVAETFIPNPEGKEIVNHINGNKLDYRIQNLEWVTQSENVLHAYRTGLIRPMGKLEIRRCA